MRRPITRGDISYHVYGEGEPNVRVRDAQGRVAEEIPLSEAERRGLIDSDLVEHGRRKNEEIRLAARKAKSEQR
ncbi:MAG: hypothetical protein ACE5JX_04870 [Acidobacteriota bacterium]